MKGSRIVIALWLLLMGVACGVFVQPQENVYRGFFFDRYETLKESDLPPPTALRENGLSNYGAILGMADYAYCHGDPVNKVDVLGAAGILVDGGMVTPEGPGGSGKLAGLLHDGDSYRRVKLLDLFKEGNLPGFEGGVCDSSGGMR